MWGVFHIAFHFQDLASGMSINETRYLLGSGARVGDNRADGRKFFTLFNFLMGLAQSIKPTRLVTWIHVFPIILTDVALCHSFGDETGCLTLEFFYFLLI